MAPALNAQQVAERMAVSVSSVYRAAQYGEIPCFRVGRSIRFDREAIEEYIEAGGHRYEEWLEASSTRRYEAWLKAGGCDRRAPQTERWMGPTQWREHV